jgi:sRNA-binding regulator protein Hfq
MGLKEQKRAAEKQFLGSSAKVSLHAHSGDNDISVMKLDSSGAYQWHTFYGSSAYDYAYGISVDSSGNVYVAGFSYATWGSPLHAHSGGYYDIFVLKLNSSGAYQWNTFYGSSAYDYAYGISVDSSGNVYITGDSDATWGSPLHAYSGGYDIFVLKLDSSGAYQWHTFYGSSTSDVAYGISVDSSGKVYVAGYSNATWGSPLHAHSGAPDIFVLKLNVEDREKLSGDFNGDGIQDILWRNSQTGQVNVWLTKPDTIGVSGKGALGTVADMNWEIIGVGNFNTSTDTITDILWRNKQTGQVNVWLVNGTALLSKGTLGTVSDLNWGIINTGNFDSNSNTDLLWRNSQTGQVNVWLTNPADIGVSSKGTLGTVADKNWEIIGVGNFNTDSNTDLLWRNKQTGQVNVWLINGTALLSKGTLGTVSDLNWGIINTGDFDSNSNTDLLWRNSQTGQVNVWLTNPAGIGILSKGSLGTVADMNWEIIGVGNFKSNDDSKTDLLWRNKQTGQVNVWLINGITLLSKGTLGTVSDLNWGIIKTGDFDSNSNTDLLWRNSQTGQVNIWLTKPDSIGVSGKGTLGTVADMNWEIQ